MGPAPSSALSVGPEEVTASLSLTFPENWGKSSTHLPGRPGGSVMEHAWVLDQCGPRAGPGRHCHPCCHFRGELRAACRVCGTMTLWEEARCTQGSGMGKFRESRTKGTGGSQPGRLALIPTLCGRFVASHASRPAQTWAWPRSLYQLLTLGLPPASSLGFLICKSWDLAVSCVLGARQAGGPHPPH